MAKGLVKWFNTAKGYGFIVSEDNPDELFVHYSAISMSGYKTLVDGEAVEFDIEKSDKGLQAKNIRRSHDTEAPVLPAQPLELDIAADDQHCPAVQEKKFWVAEVLRLIKLRLKVFRASLKRCQDLIKGSRRSHSYTR